MEKTTPWLITRFPLGTGMRPHSAWPGYVCERVSNDPQRPGHVAIFRRHEAADHWPEAIPGSNQWIVACLDGGKIVSFSTEPSEDKARRTMKRLCLPARP